MDNNINLDPKQIKSLIEKLKSSEGSSQEGLEKIAGEYLSPSQLERLKNIMNDPQLIKSILSSPQGMKILKQLKGESNES
ncbi:MAG: hypothetical protein IJ262_00255 [Clostridia bacterium]|nr:hypothetical protein [Clostridia bacterium]